MTHPAFYQTVPFNGLHVMEVDPGTVVTDERTGQKITVDDETMAVKGSVCFVTKKVFEAIKARIPSHPFEGRSLT